MLRQADRLCSGWGDVEELGHFVVEKALSRLVGLNPFAVEDELGDGALAGVGDNFFGGAGGALDVDLGVRDGMRFEEALGGAAIAAPVGGINEEAHASIFADFAQK